jgi:hypothetical protein
MLVICNRVHQIFMCYAEIAYLVPSDSKNLKEKDDDN